MENVLTLLNMSVINCLKYDNGLLEIKNVIGIVIPTNFPTDNT